jgi:hypothetical protein
VILTIVVHVKTVVSSRVAHSTSPLLLSHKSDPRWTVGTCTTRTCGYTAPYQPTEFSTEGLRAYGRNLTIINHQIPKSLPNLTTFPSSNYPKYNTRYKLSVFSICSIWWLYCSCIMSKVRYGWSIQNLRRFRSKFNSLSATLYLVP